MKPYTHPQPTPARPLGDAQKKRRREKANRRKGLEESRSINREINAIELKEAHQRRAKNILLELIAEPFDPVKHANMKPWIDKAQEAV